MSQLHFFLTCQSLGRAFCCLPKTPPPPPDEKTLAWSARVWSQLSQRDCEGLLWIALRYDRTRSTEETVSYVDHMAQLPWKELGIALQWDLARTFIKLLKQLQS